jgi:lysophospholipase L1-like esterase
MTGMSIRKVAAAAAVGGGGLTVLTGMSIGLVVAEAKLARRAIGEAMLTPPRADGLFAAHVAQRADAASGGGAGVGRRPGRVVGVGRTSSSAIARADERRRQERRQRDHLELRARRERLERRGRARKTASGYLYESDAIGAAGASMAAVLGAPGIAGTAGCVGAGAQATETVTVAATANGYDYDNANVSANANAAVTPMRFAVLGDSTAAGYGVDRPEDTPGALLSVALAEHTGRPVLLANAARVGACSDRLHEQIDQLLADGNAPQVAAIMIGANDITHRLPPVEAARQLGEAVTRLREVGCAVVVGTCPDLGTIRPIQPPLRWLARRWSRRLAKLQATEVYAAGGRSVPLGTLLGPEFAKRSELFGPDRFHPSAEGYATAVAAMLPALAAAAWQIVREPDRDRGSELALPFAFSAYGAAGSPRFAPTTGTTVATAGTAATAEAAVDVPSVTPVLEPAPELTAAVLRSAESKDFRRTIIGSGPDSALA